MQQAFRNFNNFPVISNQTIYFTFDISGFVYKSPHSALCYQCLQIIDQTTIVIHQRHCPVNIFISPIPHTGIPQMFFDGPSIPSEFSKTEIRLPLQAGKIMEADG